MLFSRSKLLWYYENGDQFQKKKKKTAGTSCDKNETLRKKKSLKTQRAKEYSTNFLIKCGKRDIRRMHTCFY
jgi:hypothetical protein